MTDELIVELRKLLTQLDAVSYLTWPAPRHVDPQLAERAERVRATTTAAADAVSDLLNTLEKKTP